MKLVTVALGVAATLGMLAYVVPFELAAHSDQLVPQSSEGLEYVVVLAWIAAIAWLIWLYGQSRRSA